MKATRPTTAVWHVGRGGLADKNGLLLIELLGSLAIIAVLVTIIFTSMSSFRNSKALQTVSEDVLSPLDEAKNNTLSAKDNYSYGLHFELQNEKFVPRANILQFGSNQ